MASMQPSCPPSRHWRLSLPISLGVLGLCTSLVIAAMSLRTQASASTAPSTSAATPADGTRWYSLGYVDVEGGKTPLYPLQLGRVRSIEAKEGEPIKAGEPLLHLEDTLPKIKVSQAEADLKAAREKLAVAQAHVEAADRQIAAQQEAINAARLKVEQAQLGVEKEKRYKGADLTDTEAVQNAEILLRTAKVGVEAEKQKLAFVRSARHEAETLLAVAHANIEGKQAQLDEARNAVKECVVRAPVDGTPLRVLVNAGQVLGSNPRQPAIWFAPQRPRLVRAEVEQEFVDRVEKGQSVVIQDFISGEECARGTVVSLADWYAPRRNTGTEVLTMNNDVRTLECIVKIESTSKEIRIDQRVRVQFTR